MRRLLFIFTLLLLTIFTYSQGEQLDFGSIEFFDTTNSSEDAVEPEVKKIDFGVDLGMSYLFSSNGLNGPALSVSPHLSYPLTDRFFVSAGISVEHGQYMIPYLSEFGIEQDLMPMTRMFVYAQGSYLVNEKLLISGSVYKQVMDVPNPNRQDQTSNYDYSGVSMSVNYKITENITIGAQIRIESPHSPLYNGVYDPTRGYDYPRYW